MPWPPPHVDDFAEVPDHFSDLYSGDDLYSSLLLQICLQKYGTHPTYAQYKEGGVSGAVVHGLHLGSQQHCPRTPPGRDRASPNWVPRLQWGVMVSTLKLTWIRGVGGAWPSKYCRPNGGLRRTHHVLR
jgi:hypothetical protein